MAGDTDSGPKKKPTMLRRALKAAVKGAMFYVVYFFLSQFLAPISEFVPGFPQMLETFVVVYIIFIVVAELTSGSIVHHFFNTAKALFVVAYLVFSLRTGIFTVASEGLSFVVDVRLLLMIAMLLGLLGLAKSVLQTIDYVNERAEIALT
jgi:hypothetical protein